MDQGLAHASNMEYIHKEIQRVCSETSDRFVPEISRKSVQADILIIMRRFKNVVKWKEFWRNQNKSTKTRLNELNEKEESRIYGYWLKHQFKD